MLPNSPLITAISLPVRVANENLFFTLNLSPSRSHNGNLPIHLLSFYPYAPQLNPRVKTVPAHATDSSPPLRAINYPIGTVISPSARAFFLAFSSFSFSKNPSLSFFSRVDGQQQACQRGHFRCSSAAPSPSRVRCFPFSANAALQICI